MIKFLAWAAIVSFAFAALAWLADRDNPWEK